MVDFKHTSVCAVICDLEKSSRIPQNFCNLQPVSPIQVLQWLGCPDLLGFCWSSCSCGHPSWEELGAFHGSMCRKSWAALVLGEYLSSYKLLLVWHSSHLRLPSLSFPTSWFHSQALISHLSSSDLASKSPFYHLPSAACLELSPGFLPQNDWQE